MIIDLHRHLGGSVPWHLLYEIGKRAGTRVGSFNSFIIKYASPVGGDIEYFTRYEMIEKIQSGPSAVRSSVWSSIIYAFITENIEYLELRFNPCYRNHKNILDIDRIIVEALSGIQEAYDIYGIKVGLLLSLDIRLPEKANLATIDKAVKYKNRGVVGIDMAGPESAIKDWKEYFKIIGNMHSSGLKTTIHFGETHITQGRMGEMLSHITPNRIGHGITSLFNEEDLHSLQTWSKCTNKHSVCIEFCPQSNIITGAAFNIAGKGTNIEWLTNLAIQTWYKNNIPFCICTDSPILLNCTIQGQMECISDLDIICWLEKNAEQNIFSS
jgi:adenosine deaminase